MQIIFGLKNKFQEFQIKRWKNNQSLAADCDNTRKWIFIKRRCVTVIFKRVLPTRARQKRGTLLINPRVRTELAGCFAANAN